MADEMQAPLAEFLRENYTKGKRELHEPSPFVIREVHIQQGEIYTNGTKIIYHPDSETIHILVHGIDGVKHGFEKIYWPSGNLKHKIEWNMGVKTGRETTWHENGVIRSIIYWKEGKETEILYTYYDDGQIRSEVPFREGIMHGTQKHYYCCGQIYAEINFFHGKRHGIEKSWHTNGKKKTQCTYVHDIIDGDEIRWDEDGLIMEHSKWNKGKLLQAVYYDKGKPVGAEIHKGNKVQIVDKMTPVKTKKTMTQKEIIAAAMAAKEAAIAATRKKFGIEEKETTTITIKRKKL
jgi:antitoxin component YwqK of YwqJK toxin-antitoxin module